MFGFKDENSAAEAQGAFGKLVRLSEAAGAFVLATMHPAKNKKKGTVRGSGVFEGSPDLILTASKGAHGHHKLTVTKSRSNAAEGQSWGYRLAPITLPNGEMCAYVDGPLRTPVPPPHEEAKSERARLTQDGLAVLEAIREASGRTGVTWQAKDGRTVYGADEKAIQAQLVVIKAGTSADTRRKTYRRGIDRLLQEGIIGQRRHSDGRTVFWDIGDNCTDADDIGQE